jgi:hypothetical protein
VSFFLLPSWPGDAPFFSSEEKAYVKAVLRADEATGDDSADAFSWSEVAKAFTSIHVLLVGVIFFFSGKTPSPLFRIPS